MKKILFTLLFITLGLSSFAQLPDFSLDIVATDETCDDNGSLTFNITNASGKTIRLPSRLMTSNDALIQAPNIIAASAFEATTEGMRRGLKDQELNDYIKGHVDGIIQYLLNRL